MDGEASVMERHLSLHHNDPMMSPSLQMSLLSQFETATLNLLPQLTKTHKIAVETADS